MAKQSVASSGLRGLLAALSLVAACGLHGDVSDLGDLIFGSGGKIPRDKLGVQNEFVSTPKGDPGAQGNDIRSTLELRHVRSSFFFDEGFLPSEGATANFARFDAKLEQRIGEVNSRMDVKFAELREFVERRIGDQTRWLYAAWAVQLTANVAVLLRLYLK